LVVWHIVSYATNSKVRRFIIFDQKILNFGILNLLQAK